MLLLLFHMDSPTLSVISVRKYYYFVIAENNLSLCREKLPKKKVIHTIKLYHQHIFPFSTFLSIFSFNRFPSLDAYSASPLPPLYLPVPATQLARKLTCVLGVIRAPYCHAYILQNGGSPQCYRIFGLQPTKVL